jgi:FKBP-type peptidyl-prolyl cis-trans isomerase 2
MPGAQREKFDEARAQRKEQAERQEQIELATDRLLEMGLPITSVERGVVTIDFNQMSVLA